VLAGGESVASHATQFLAKHVASKNRRSTADAVGRTFNNVVLPAWGARPVGDIRRRDVIDLVDTVASERGPYAAEWLLAVLSKFFRWLLSRDVIGASPCLGVERPKRRKPRQRTLSEPELLALLKATSSDHPMDRVVWVLALTGCRRNEVARMKWSELKTETRIWTIPAERSKNHREHIVPLSAQTWRIIDAQPHMANCDYVFSITSRGPVNDWDNTKKRLSEKSGLIDWRIHDIRRTVASGMQRLGVRTEVIERALGHHSGTFKGIVGVYQTDPLEHEVRAALQCWADYIEELIEGKTAKAVANKRR
jgi:integrase